jgi:hypothetical protein
MTRLVWVLVCLMFAGSATATAQSPAAATPISSGPVRHSEDGRPFIRAYRPTEVGGAGQIWSMLQDRRGVMYIGTNGAVLEFDGSSWRRIRLEPGGSGRSLALDPSGRIYVGSASAFGYLAPDEHGDMAFVSLVSRLPEDARSFNDVWRTFVTTDGVIFQTERAIFKWAADRFTIIKPTSRFNRASLVDGRIYLTMPETGLNVLEGDKFRPLPGTESLGLEPFPIILRLDEKRLLIGTRQRAFFLYDGSTLVPFPTELDALATTGQLYRGVALPDGTIALTTTSGGMGILDRQGRRVTTVSRANGLPSDVVYFAMPDREGSLWLGLDNGMARVETPSPLSFYNEADGLPGYVNRAHRHAGRLYFALQTGIYYLEPASGPTGNARFEQVAGVSNQCWWLATVPDASGVRSPALAAACTAGLFEITGTRPSCAPR